MSTLSALLVLVLVLIISSVVVLVIITENFFQYVCSNFHSYVQHLFLV